MNTLSGQKVLVVLARSSFREDELAGVRAALEAVGAIPILTSPDGGDAVGPSGARVSTVIVSDPRASELAGAIVLSEGGQHVRSSGLVQKSLRVIAREGKPIAAIGTAAAVLARAGLLTGKRATTFVTAEMLHELKEGGVHYEKRPVVVDGALLTSDGSGNTASIVTMFLELAREALARKSGGSGTHMRR